MIHPGETIQGLRANLTRAIETLCDVDSSVAVSSGGKLFLRFISLTSLEYSVSPALLGLLSTSVSSCRYSQLYLDLTFTPYFALFFLGLL